MKNRSFSSLGLQPEVIKNLDLLGFQQMTEIQAEALPHILSGVDVVAEAQTGSGKTAAFALGMLNKVDIQNNPVQGIVLCPTRELAAQVAIEIRTLARLVENLKVLVLAGGTPIAPQVESLQHGAHIVVGTPGRISDHLKRRSLKLSTIQTLVLDEADRMLDMGFAESIRAIIKQTPPSRQTLLFSATFPDGISELSKGIQRNPLHIKLANSAKNESIQELYFEVDKDAKLPALHALMATYRPESSIVFCATKLQCNEVAKFLRERGLLALAIHGDLEQVERDEVMVRFTNRSISCLVATDVAARGLDIDDLAAVVNFEVSRDPEVHVHRIGRTGRAGRRGLALTLYTSRDHPRLEAIEQYTGHAVCKKDHIKKTSEAKLKVKPPMVTLKIFGGKKSKLRPGDILGALTQVAGLEAKFVGKIHIFENNAYVAIDRHHAHAALRDLSRSKIKNKNFGMKII